MMLSLGDWDECCGAKMKASRWHWIGGKDKVLLVCEICEHRHFDEMLWKEYEEV